MAQVVYSAAAYADLGRLFERLDADDPTLAVNSVTLIRNAIRDLAAQPLLGRPAEAGLRERAISRGLTGYVALYRFFELEDTVLVVAIRHRHQAGYPSPG